MAKKILIISQCTGKKRDELCRADELYTGLQHQRLMKGIAETQGKIEADLYLVSAGHGVVPASRKLEPYNITFKGKKMPEIRQMADALSIPKDMTTLLTKGGYDEALIILGGSYLAACQFAGVEVAQPTTFMTTATWAKRLPKKLSGAIDIVTLGPADTRTYSCGLVGLKGEVARRWLAEKAA